MILEENNNENQINLVKIDTDNGIFYKINSYPFSITLTPEYTVAKAIIAVLSLRGYNITNYTFTYKPNGKPRAEKFKKFLDERVNIMTEDAFTDPLVMEWFDEYILYLDDAIDNNKIKMSEKANKQKKLKSRPLTSEEKIELFIQENIRPNIPKKKKKYKYPRKIKATIKNKPEPEDKNER